MEGHDGPQDLPSWIPAGVLALAFTSCDELGLVT